MRFGEFNPAAGTENGVLQLAEDAGALLGVLICSVAGTSHPLFIRTSQTRRLLPPWPSGTSP